MQEKQSVQAHIITRVWSITMVHHPMLYVHVLMFSFRCSFMYVIYIHLIIYSFNQNKASAGHQCGTTTAAGGGAGGRAGGRVWQWVQVHHLRVAGQAGRRRLVIYGAEAA